MSKLIQTSPFRLQPTALIVLIILVGGLLLFQLVGDGFNAGDGVPADRESCLRSGYIWSQSAGKCYETGGTSDQSMAHVININS